MLHKKTIIFLAIFVLLTPGFLPHGFININSKETIKNNQIAHAELCCCGNLASECRDCCCSKSHEGTDNTGKHTVTITACCGTSDNIITISKLNYFSSLSVIVQYISVATMAETATSQFKNVLTRQLYKPPKSQLLSNFT